MDLQASAGTQQWNWLLAPHANGSHRGPAALTFPTAALSHFSARLGASPAAGDGG